MLVVVFSCVIERPVVEQMLWVVAGDTFGCFRHWELGIVFLLTVIVYLRCFVALILDLDLKIVIFFLTEIIVLVHYVYLHLALKAALPHTEHSPNTTNNQQYQHYRQKQHNLYRIKGLLFRST